MIEQPHQIDASTYVGLDVQKHISMETIFAKVCKFLKIDQEEMKGKARFRELVDARHIFCYLAYHSISEHTLKEIGNFINKDHATVLHGKNKIADLIQSDRGIHEKVETLKGMLGRFTSEAVESKAITAAHVGWYNSPERKRALKLWAENNDIVSKIKVA